jgi:prevent-host-death family protein
MQQVGVRELKNRLSQYLRHVRAGEVVEVTERGRLVAYLVPSRSAAAQDELQALIKQGLISWEGGKPTGLDRPVRVGGKPLSQMIIEDRE